MTTFGVEKPATEWFKYAGLTAGAIIGVAGIMVVLFLGVAIALNAESFFRPLAADSKLAWSEARIEHIPSEFVRRSEAFAMSWDLLKMCGRDDLCDMNLVLKIRDYAIAKDWPIVFDRLLVFDDWGEASDSKSSRDAFFAALRTHGEEKLRSACLPKITFAFKDDGRFYNFDGFVCS